MPDDAQPSGRSLLNLRCADVEGGLLGRTLLSLVSNKVLPLLLPSGCWPAECCLQGLACM